MIVADNFIAVGNNFVKMTFDQESIIAQSLDSFLQNTRNIACLAPIDTSKCY